MAVDLPMLAASGLFTAATVYGAVVGLREDIPGEPFGWRAPGRVSVHIAAGWGCGTMAPWPMPLATLIAAIRTQPGTTTPGRVCLGVGAGCLIGTLAEPITWGLRSRSGAVTATIALHLLSGTALVLAGRRAILAA